VFEARDIRSPGVIDTESRHGVQLDAPVILDSPFDLRIASRERQFEFEFATKNTACRDYSRKIQMLCETLIKLFDELR